MPLFLVRIKDKELRGEPDIALAVVEATDETNAVRAADELVIDLAESGRGRCVPRACEPDLGRFYRVGTLIRMPEVE
jgi:hypothetical protein